MMGAADFVPKHGIRRTSGPEACRIINESLEALPLRDTTLQHCTPLSLAGHSPDTPRICFVSRGFPRASGAAVPAMVIYTFAWGRKTAKTSCLYIFCVELDPTMPKHTYQNEALLCGLNIMFRGTFVLYNLCNIFENLIDFRTVLKIDVLCDTVSVFVRPQDVKNSMFAWTLCWNWPTHAQNTS